MKDYPCIALEEISTGTTYTGLERDMESTPIEGLKKYEDYPCIRLEEISGLPLYST